MFSPRYLALGAITGLAILLGGCSRNSGKAIVEIDLTFADSALSIEYQIPQTSADSIMFSTTNWAGVEDYYRFVHRFSATAQDGSLLPVNSDGRGHFLVRSNGNPFTG